MTPEQAAAVLPRIALEASRGGDAADAIAAILAEIPTRRDLALVLQEAALRTSLNSGHTAVRCRPEEHYQICALVPLLQHAASALLAAPSAESSAAGDAAGAEAVAAAAHVVVAITADGHRTLVEGHASRADAEARVPALDASLARERGLHTSLWCAIGEALFRDGSIASNDHVQTRVIIDRATDEFFATVGIADPEQRQRIIDQPTATHHAVETVPFRANVEAASQG